VLFRSDEELLDRAEEFVWQTIRLGVTTIECKSGYGLSLEQELRLLSIYRRLQDRVPVELVPTLLAAHAVPPEVGREKYVEIICNEIIPQSADLAGYCDVFVEEGAFTIDEARRILETGLRHGLRPKLHADQLTDSGGARLAAEVGAASGDHLEYASEEGLAAMADRGVVAVHADPERTGLAGCRALRRRRDRLQPRQRAHVSYAARDDTGMRTIRDDSGGGAQGGDDHGGEGD